MTRVPLPIPREAVEAGAKALFNQEKGFPAAWDEHSTGHIRSLYVAKAEAALTAAFSALGVTEEEQLQYGRGRLTVPWGPRYAAETMDSDGWTVTAIRRRLVSEWQAVNKEEER